MHTHDCLYEEESVIPLCVPVCAAYSELSLSFILLQGTRENEGDKQLMLNHLSLDGKQPPKKYVCEVQASSKEPKAGDW